MLCFSVVPPIGWKEIDLSPSRRESQIDQAGQGSSGQIETMCFWQKRCLENHSEEHGQGAREDEWGTCKGLQIVPKAGRMEVYGEEGVL